MLLDTTEVNVEFVEMLQEGAKRGAFGHLCESVDIFRETFATITVLTIGTRNVRVGIVDVTGEENTGVNLSPICSHLLAILFARIEIGYFVRTEDVVHILGELCFKRRHYRKFLADEDLGEQIPAVWKSILS